MKYIFAIMALAFVWGCSSPAEPAKDAQNPAQQEQAAAKQPADMIEGTWIKPIEGQPGKTDGMTLQSDGNVLTINMATMIYKHWKRDGNTLNLTGMSMGNGVNSEFDFNYKIKKLDDTTLVLNLDGVDFTYTKVN